MMTSRKPLSTHEQSASLLLGSCVAALIAFSPYLFYLYEIFPSGPVWETSFFTYESKYYLNVLTAAWTFLGKITPLILLLIWFFTCKHWWYHVILVPTTMYAYQLIVAVYEDINYTEDGGGFIDTNQLIYLAPFFIVILSIVYLIRIKMFDRIYGIDLTEIERENISPFSPFSDKEYNEIKEFREEVNSKGELQEEYYAKL